MIKHMFMKPSKIILFFGYSLSFMHVAFAAKGAHKNLEAHVHGEGSFNFVIDQKSNQAELNFKFPALQVLGFEHKPKTSAEKKVHADSHLMLKDPKNIFTLVTDTQKPAGCVFGDSVLKIPYIEESHTGHSHKGHDHDHADYELTYKISCQDIAQLSGFNLEAFKKLKNLDKLKVEGLSGDKSISTLLTPARTEVSIK